MRIAFLVIAGLALAACNQPSAAEMACEHANTCANSDVSNDKACAPTEACYEADIKKGGACATYANLADKKDACFNTLSCDCLTSPCATKCLEVPVSLAQFNAAKDAAIDAGCGCEL